MAHEIYENDKMFSVNETPWHGLGEVLTETPDIATAIVASGLDWNVSLETMIVPMVIDDMGTKVDIPVLNQKAIVRQDNHSVLGVVGNRYELYQNSEMWSFIEAFQSISGVTLETAGSLKNGRTTWVLAKNVTEMFEAVPNDPIEKYFLFRNSFDGTSPVSVLFTDIRVVCNNTLTMALKGAKSLFNVRHTASMQSQIADAAKALSQSAKYQEKFEAAMVQLVNTKMTGAQIDSFIENTLFPVNQQLIQDLDKGDSVLSLDEMKGRGATVRLNKIEAVKELVACGAGADIKGVEGTAYGLYNAVTEWCDHSKTTRVVGDGDSHEAKFVNAFYGSGVKVKNDCLNALLKAA